MAYCLLKEKELYVPGSLTKKDNPVKPCRQIIGQDRALAALNLGIQLKDTRSHLFCLGPKGVGRTSLTLDIVRQYAASQKTPQDWVYVLNFKQPLYPQPIALEAGQGIVFSNDMKKLTQNLKKNSKAALVSENYLLQVNQVQQKFQNEKQENFQQLSQKINTKDIALIQTPKGLTLNPVVNGQVLNADDFNKLPLEIRMPIIQQMKKTRQKLLELMQKSPDPEVEKQKQLNSLKKQVLTQIAEQCFDPFLKKYKNSNASTFLTDAQKHFLENYEPLLQLSEWLFLQVNVLTSHTPNSGAPVVHLHQLSFSGLLGKIEQKQQSGATQSDHTLIQAGALHQANGGFLMIEAKDILESKIAWQTLKQALFTLKIKMQLPPDDKTLMHARLLKPQEIPLNLKVILVGDIGTYNILADKDEEFRALFKYPVCFEDKLPRTKENEKLYAGVLTDFIQQNHLKPFDLEAMNLLLAYAARLADEQVSLTAHFIHIHDLMKEADFIARHKMVTKEDVMETFKNRRHRTSIAQQNWLNMLKRKLVRLNLEGYQVGQINALVTTGIRDFTFGHPSRVTCRVHLGKGKIENIEHEVAQDGHIHNKGVFLLSAYLTGQYGIQEPFCWDASLAWEQTYHGVEGDSASAAQLCVLISAITNIPLNQSFAITGSVNQLGEIQSIGAVNMKIEGFFDACQATGLTGHQGVIIPSVCQQDLMLSDRVRQAVHEGRFHIYTVQTINDALEILTNQKASIIDQKMKQAWHSAYLKMRHQN